MMKKQARLSSKRIKDMILYGCLILLPLTQFLIFYVGVNAKSLMFVFQRYENDGYVFNGFNNFKELSNILKDEFVIQSFRNSFTVLVISIVVSIPLGLLFSNYIYKKCVGSTMFKLILFIPSIIPAAIMTLLFRSVTDSIFPAIVRLTNSTTDFIGLIGDTRYAFSTVIVYSIIMGFGTNILMYVGSMSAIPESVVEAAELDGCNAFQEFIHITIPYVWPTLATFLVVTVGGIFNNHLNVYTFYGTGADKSVYTMGHYLFYNMSTAQKVDYPRLATFGVFLTFIVAPITLITRWALNKFGYKTE